jgi:maltose 6'-phosphate phosphatase
MKAFTPVLLASLCSSAIPVLQGQATCPDAGTRRTLNVMTVNLLFSEIRERTLRLDRIAAYLAARASDPIDVILVQESVSGPLALTSSSSARELKALLANKGLPFNLAERYATGVPFLLWVGNGILSRCKIDFTLSALLPVVTEEPFENLSVPFTRSVMVSRLEVPGAGRVHVYNTHYCAYCDTATERTRQNGAALAFIAFVERWFRSDAVIFGGDLNTDISADPADSDYLVYGAITGAGFADTWAAHSGQPFCTPATMAGCTYGAPGNPYAGGLLPAGPPARIDYLFVRPGRLSVADSAVVFRTAAEGFVSDHSALVTKFTW